MPCCVQALLSWIRRETDVVMTCGCLSAARWLEGGLITEFSHPENLGLCLTSLLHHAPQFADNKSEWKLGGTWKKTLSRELKKMTASGQLKPGKTSGKYKLSDAAKKPAPKVRLACFNLCIASCRSLVGIIDLRLLSAV